MRATSATVAPARAKPVDVLTKSAPAAFARTQAATFSSSVSNAASMITLLMTPASRQGRGDGFDIAPDCGEIAGFQGADIDDHVDLTRAVEDRSPCLVLFDVCGRRSEWKSSHRTDASHAPRSRRAQRDTHVGLTHTVAKPNSRASRHDCSIRSLVASGLRSVWSMMDAMSPVDPPVACNPSRVAPASISPPI